MAEECEIHYEQKYITEDDIIIGELYNEKETLLKIGFPLEDYEDDIKEHGEQIVTRVILEELIDEDYQIVSEYKPKHNYLITDHIVKDYCGTDRGYQDCSFSLGYKVTIMEDKE